MRKITHIIAFIAGGTFGIVVLLFVQGANRGGAV